MVRPSTCIWRQRTPEIGFREKHSGVPDRHLLQSSHKIVQRIIHLLEEQTQTSSHVAMSVETVLPDKEDVSAGSPVEPSRDEPRHLIQLLRQLRGWIPLRLHPLQRIGKVLTDVDSIAKERRVLI